MIRGDTVNQAPTLQIEDLILRKPLESDIQDRLKCGRVLEHVRMYGGDTRNINELTLVDATKWYEQMLKNPLEWSIEYQGECIGQARLTVWKSDNRARYAIGIFNTNFINKGLGEKVTKLVLDFAFNTLKVHRVDLKVLNYNHRAIRCYEKCGFIVEGTEREGALIEGKYEDDLIMSILEQEYFND